MVLVELAERKLAIPEGVQIEVQGRTVKVTGPKGTLQEDFAHLPVQFALEGQIIRVYSTWARKREVALVGTALAHVRNMIRGVTSGFTFKLKIVYAHFPVTVKVNEKEKKLTIDNFTGEKTARVVKIVGSAKVKLASDEIHVQGINLNDVSQTAANIQYATKIPDKDQRVFLDGIYIFEKKEGIKCHTSAPTSSEKRAGGTRESKSRGAAHAARQAESDAANRAGRRSLR